MYQGTDFWSNVVLRSHLRARYIVVSLAVWACAIVPLTLLLACTSGQSIAWSRKGVMFCSVVGPSHHHCAYLDGTMPDRKTVNRTLQGGTMRCSWTRFGQVVDRDDVRSGCTSQREKIRGLRVSDQCRDVSRGRRVGKGGDQSSLEGSKHCKQPWMMRLFAFDKDTEANGQPTSSWATTQL